MTIAILLLDTDETKHNDAPTGNRTRVPSMGSLDATTTPLVRVSVKCAALTVYCGRGRRSKCVYVSYGVRTHAQLPAVDLKSTPLTTRAN